MRCRFNELNADGDYTDYINVLTEDGVAPDWVEVELSNKLSLELAKGILDGNPDFNSIILNDKCGFEIDVDPNFGRWDDARLSVNRWSGYFILISADYNEIEVDITEMVKAYIRGDSYEPRS
jgi:hypothetical protein